MLCRVCGKLTRCAQNTIARQCSGARVVVGGGRSDATATSRGWDVGSEMRTSIGVVCAHSWVGLGQSVDEKVTLGRGWGAALELETGMPAAAGLWGGRFALSRQESGVRRDWHSPAQTVGRELKRVRAAPCVELCFGEVEFGSRGYSKASSVSPGNPTDKVIGPDRAGLGHASRAGLCGQGPCLQTLSFHGFKQLWGLSIG